jgi:hypothetical protein
VKRAFLALTVTTVAGLVGGASAAIRAAAVADAPVVTTLPATHSLATGWILHGRVDPGGRATTAQFVYGPTTAYGQTVAVSPGPGAGTTEIDVFAAVSDLVCGTVYHFRFEATNGDGVDVGDDLTFTTGPCATATGVTPIEFPGAVSTFAFGINDAGQIVGSYTESGGRQRGYIRNGTTFTTIDYPSAQTTRVTGINNAGDMVGCYDSGALCNSGFLLSGGTFTPIAYPGSTTTVPLGINDDDDIVGFANSVNAFLLRDGTFSPIEHPSPQEFTTFVNAISNEPAVVGAFNRSLGGPFEGFVSRAGVFSPVAYPGAPQSTLPNAVNTAGQIVGDSQVSGGPQERFLLSGGVFSLLNVGGPIRGINNVNQVVGYELALPRAYVATLSGTPQLLRVAPPRGNPGQTNLDVIVYGAFTHFVQGVTIASFGSGVTVNSVTVQNATQATVNVSIAGGAALGSRTITLTTAAEVVSLTDGFWVNSSSLAITNVTPASGRQAQANLDVVVTGAFTHFAQGVTTASFGTGVTVHGMTVQSATQATVTVSIPADAALGARTVTMTTGGEVASLSGGFEVLEGTPALISATPNTGRRRRMNLPIHLTGQYTHFSQATTTVSFGPDITVHSIIVQTPTVLTASVTIGAAAALGARNVTVTTATEVVELVNGFVVESDLLADGDFDGDLKSDIGIFRPSTGDWFYIRSSSGLPGGFSWGVSGDALVPGDYTGDGKTDQAIYRPSNGRWFIQKAIGSVYTYSLYEWGVAGDVPVPADYEGDGVADVAVYRPSDGSWYFLKSSSDFDYLDFGGFRWGLTGDVPAPGDYDGDGKADPAVYRPSTGVWFVLRSSTGYTTYDAYQWGISGDIPVHADYDGDRKTDIAIYRPSTGQWYVLRSTTGFTSGVAYTWGATGDVPAPGDYDADGKTDLGIYRPSTGDWFILKSTSNYTTFDSRIWGTTGDVAILGRQ